jgi:aspartate/methionine/tyrosine aminotransferase
MTRDDIIRMAREAGFRAGHIELYGSDPMPFVAPCSATDCMPELVRFAAIVAAAEREACAKVCEEIEDDYRTRESLRYAELRTDADIGASDCAHRIRARGDAKGE